MENAIISHKGGGITFAGPVSADLVAATVLKSAMALYVKTGLKVNRLYTPSNMLKAASRITGKTYPRSKQAMGRALNDLAEWIEETRKTIPVIRQD